mmetsp:Transcript_9375/g.14813  ORF Transcript_9375/g.14813 Transcript_9375/m.14813 type:complete len:207 (-) Transcript_9375:483-1103(-)
MRLSKSCEAISRKLILRVFGSLFFTSPLTRTTDSTPAKWDRMRISRRSRLLAMRLKRSDILRRASSHAFPSPQASKTFSVPARRPDSCPAPHMKGTISSKSFRIYSAPMPLGAYSLCPAMVSRSTPSSSTFTVIFPTAWLASVWKMTFGLEDFAALTSSCTGWIVPTSLFASIMLITTVLSLTAFAKIEGETLPSSLTGSNVTSKP